MATKNTEIILEEIEALRSILLDELHVSYNSLDQPTGVETTVVPATAQNVEQQHVCVTLVITYSEDYPDSPPSILLRNPRGIDDDILKKILSESKEKCDEYAGIPVVYTLIELVRENLTANNTPSCPCAICLFHFTELDVFTKTACYHYFHSHCLGRYIRNCEESEAAEREKEENIPSWVAREKRQRLCPVCRELLSDQLSSSELLAHPSPEEEQHLADFDPECAEIKELQEKMARLYSQQLAKGGIINLEEERNKFLISSVQREDAHHRHTHQLNSPQSSVPGKDGSDKKGILDKQGGKFVSIAQGVQTRERGFGRQGKPGGRGHNQRAKRGEWWTSGKPGPPSQGHSLDTPCGRGLPQSGACRGYYKGTNHGIRGHRRGGGRGAPQQCGIEGWGSQGDTYYLEHERSQPPSS